MSRLSIHFTSARPHLIVRGLGEPIIVNDRFSAQFIQMMDRYLRIYSARFASNAK